MQLASGAVEGTSTAQVAARINDTMTPVVAPENLSIFVNDASIYDMGTPPTTASGIEGLPGVELSSVEPRQMFVVRATLPYNDIALVPMPFLKNVVLYSQAFMRHE